MPQPWVSSALLAAALLGLSGAHPADQPSRLRVSSYPDGLEGTPFRLSTAIAGVRIAGTVTLPPGKDTVLVTPVWLDLDPSATATLDASGTGGLTLLILPDSAGGSRAVFASGPRVRITRSGAGRYALLEAKEARQVELSVF
ncbi:MAG: hypothetical protein SF070_00635 [Gemmatimonadota bacterium]|nr:hypothetical protein [Gemmatimonadota bacterium]